MPGLRDPAPPPRLPNLAFQEFLASGGFADVYLYEQEFPRQRVAVKVLRQRSATLEQDFINEANRLAGLGEHPNIVRISAASVSDDGRAYMVMEYCPPPHLGQRCRPNGLPVDEALRIGVKVCGAVAAAHRSGILHRDIKPANILVRASKEPVLIDFGIAGERRGSELDEGAGVSVPYAAPEVLFSDAPGDETSDLYSLGATLYALVAGRSPYEVRGGDNSQEGLLSRMRASTPPSTGKPGVPDGLEALLQYALARQPRSRPQSAAALARAIQEVERSLGYRPTDFFDGTIGTEGDAKPRQTDDPDGTRAQIQVVSPDRSTSQPRPSAAPFEPSVERFDVPDAHTGTRGAHLPDGLELQTQTAGRRRAQAPEPAEATVAPSSTSSKTRIVAGVLVIAAVVAVAAASILGGSEDPTGDDTTSTTGTNQLSAVLEPVSDVTLTREGTVVRVAWADSANPAGTQYHVTYTDDVGEHEEVTGDRELVVHDESLQCAEVEAFLEGYLRPSPARRCLSGEG